MSCGVNPKLIVDCWCYSNPGQKIAVIYSCKAFASAVGWDAEPHEFHITHGRTMAGHLSAIKVSFRAVVMWNYEPLSFQSFTLASQMNRRTLGPMPGCPLICLNFYSSHQFAEATLTNAELMAEHLHFKTVLTSTMWLDEKNITSGVIYSTTLINVRWSEGEYLGKCVQMLGFWGNLMGTQQRTSSTKNRSHVVNVPFCLSPYKDPFQSHCTFPVRHTSAHHCNSTGISTLNSFFLCLLGQQLQTGTEKLKLEQRLLYISYFVVSHICAYRKKKSHIPHSKKLCFTKLGRNFLRSSLFCWC